jgi:tape measure domain-containing protein
MATTLEIRIPISPEVPAGKVNAALAQLKKLYQSAAAGAKMGSPIDAGKINADAAKVHSGLQRVKDGFAAMKQAGIDAAQKIGQAMKGLQKETGDAEKKLGGMGSLLKGGLFVGAAAGVGALSKSMISGNAELEGYMTQFEVLTGSLENGTKLFADIKKMGLQTPFETKDLAAATQTMLGFGIAQEDIIPHLQQLGDISGGNAEKLKSLSLVFSQVSANGKLMGGDLLQFINAGFNPLKVMSEQTGKSMGELRKEMENGAISSQMVADAMKAATGAGGQFEGMMAKQATTMNGMTSTLKDVASETLNTMGKPLFEETKKAMGGLLTLLQSPEIQAAVQKLGTSIAPLVQALAGVPWRRPSGISSSRSPGFSPRPSRPSPRSSGSSSRPSPGSSGSWGM